jgi:hypothetical protein
MQSPSTAARRTSTALAILAWGVLPLLGLCAEIATGMLSSELPLFPSLGWIAAVVLAVFANLALHADATSNRLPLLASALLHAFVLGMAVLYAAAELPAILVIVMLIPVGFGALAAAPFLTLIGMVRLLPRLARRWSEAGGTPANLVLLLLAGAGAPAAICTFGVVERNQVHRCMQELAASLDGGSFDRQERLAAQLRELDLAWQLHLVRMGTTLALPWSDHPGAAHLADGRPFWFVQRLCLHDLSQRDAADAFYRAHGRSGLEPQPGGRDRQVRSRSLHWHTSEFEAHVEPAAGVARVDWLLEVHASSMVFQEARFDLRLPFGAVASSLSMWIEGEERPAAFAGAGEVRKAYEKVVATRRDPALLTETDPGQLQLLVFPVARQLPPARVRVSFTVPIATRGEHGLLSLPDIAAHNCNGGTPAAHHLTVVTADRRESHTVPIDAPPPELRTARPDAVTFTEDADGVLTQTVRSAPTSTRTQDAPLLVVVEASASVARLGPDLGALFEGLATGQPCSVFVACGGTHFERVDGEVGAPSFRAALARIPCRGGCDPARALQAALQEAEQHAEATGTGEVLWLHGAVPRRLEDLVPTVPENVRIEAYALASGGNALADEPTLAAAIERQWCGAVTARQASEVIANTAPRHGDGLRVGDSERRFARSETPPPGAVRVSDQLARLWAGWRARDLLRTGGPVDAADLASRYRVATAGVGAVVLENQRQYEQHALDPGAAIGREPEGVVGGGPVPEPTTILLLGSGLLALLWAHRRRQRPAAG